MKFKAIKKVFFALFLLMSLSYLFIVISPKIFKGFYPFGIKTAIVLTGSMEPTLNIDDFVILREFKGRININDIVSYKREGEKNEVLHRVVSVDKNVVITKGDANNKEDEPIDIQQITGIYVRKVKYLGKIIVFFTKPLGISIMVTLFLIILLFPMSKE